MPFLSLSVPVKHMTETLPANTSTNDFHIILLRKEFCLCTSSLACDLGGFVLGSWLATLLIFHKEIAGNVSYKCFA